MNFVNRIIIALVAALALVAAAITLMVVVKLVPPGDVAMFAPQLSQVAAASGGEVAGIVALCIVIMLAMLTLIIFEFLPVRQPPTIILSEAEQGTSSIDNGSVCLLAEKTAVTVHGIREADCSVRESEKGLIISCRAMLSIGSDVVEASDELQIKIKGVVEELTGLIVGRVNLRVKYEPAGSRRLDVR